MKPHFLPLVVGLLVVSLLSACSSAPPSVAATAAPVGTATVTRQVIGSQTVLEDATSTVTSVPVQAVATSRGPNLEATDPNTVSLASGQLQLVEFFRFT